MEHIEGDLIKLALEGEFDVITHGCNCMCTMGSGIAVQMARNFHCNDFPKEEFKYSGDFNKLGTIDYIHFSVEDGVAYPIHVDNPNYENKLIVVNSYTQLAPGQPSPPYGIPLDYDALRMCFRKINRQFSGKYLGIPQIGCGLAGGDWDKVEKIIDEETSDMEVTCVIYKQ